MKLNQTLFTLLIIILVIPYKNLSAQRRGYVKTKNAVYEQGKVSYSKSKRNEVTLRTSKMRSTTYFASDIESFGLFKTFGNDSITYVSKKLIIAGKEEYIFLRKHLHGQYTLLELEGRKSRFFYQKSSSITELTPKNYQSKLKELTKDKESWRFQNSRVGYNLSHLAQFFSTLNDKGNRRINLPKTQFFASFVSGQISLSNLNSLNGFLSDSPVDLNDISFGIARYVPLGTKKRWGLINHLTFERYSIKQNDFTDNLDRSAVINFDRLLLEVSPTYLITSGRLTTYSFIGLTGGILLNDNSEYFEADLSNNGQIIFDASDDFVSHNTVHAGIVYGAGIDFSLTSTLLVSLEFRFTNSIQAAGDIEKMSTNKLTLKLGL